ncbi:pseudouridine synthase, partial [Streptomyces spectabilis]
MRSSSGRNSSGNNGGSRGGNSGGRGNGGGRPSGGGRGNSGGRPTGGGRGNSGGGGARGNFRGAGNDRDDKQGSGRPSKPRPEERRYDVGPGASQDGPKSGRGASARGGGHGGPQRSQDPPRGR